MKKVFAMTASIILFIVAANAQSEKEPPPPPPPPMVGEKPKPPKPPSKIDKKVNVKSEPPKVVMTKFTPPKIVKDEEVQVLPATTVKGKLADEFYEKNPTVSDVSRQGNIITIKKKDGTTEKYDMNKKDEDKSFTEKYGDCPIPPPPPPPKMKSKA